MKVKLKENRPGEKGEKQMFYGVPFVFDKEWQADLPTAEARAMIEAGRAVEVKAKK